MLNLKPEIFDLAFFPFNNFNKLKLRLGEGNVGQKIYRKNFAEISGAGFLEYCALESVFRGHRICFISSLFFEKLLLEFRVYGRFDNRMYIGSL